jgi:hypothetical protein
MPYIGRDASRPYNCCHRFGNRLLQQQTLIVDFPLYQTGKKPYNLVMR